MQIVDFEPFRQGGHIDYAAMAALRAGPGLARMPSGLIFVSRYADHRTVMPDNRRFSNEGGMRAPGIVVPREERLINEMDPPDHTRLRRFEQTTLNQAHFKAIAPYVEALAQRLVEALPVGASIDLVPHLTGPLPSIITGHVIGVPPADSEQFRRWSIDVVTSEYVSHNATERGRGLHGSHPEFSHYLDALIEERRSSETAPDDLVTRMVREEIDGHAMTNTELRSAIAHLIMAGNETTTAHLNNLLLRLLADPELWEALARDRSRIPNTVEESLRLDSPVQVSVRRVTEDVELSGIPIAKGERLWLGLGSANRDEAHFGADAEHFRIDRPNAADHVAFGLGPHLCLGAGLARIESRAMVEALLDRFARGGLAPDWRYTPMDSYWELSPASVDAVLQD